MQYSLHLLPLRLWVQGASSYDRVTKTNIYLRMETQDPEVRIAGTAPPPPPHRLRGAAGLALRRVAVGAHSFLRRARHHPCREDYRAMA